MPDKRNGNDYRVSFLSKQDDFDCVMLAEFGMELNTIAGYTGLSVNQVVYRLHKLGVRIRDFRQGRGKYARLVFEHLGRRAAAQLVTDVRSITNG